MGLVEAEYHRVAPQTRFGSRQEAYGQDYVLVLRCPTDDELHFMKPGACLISMLHYPTRPERVALLRELQIEAISIDSLKDDSGRRLVENLRSVAWNGIEVAIRVLRKTYPDGEFNSPQRAPVRVTLLGAGAVGSHVVQSAVRYGNDALRKSLVGDSVPGVQVTVVDYDLTGHASIMRDLLGRTDILVDATQRPDPSRIIIPNEWVGDLPEHAVILDLSVDPEDRSATPPRVKGIEGIPAGSLDQYVFEPDDPAFDTLPGVIDKRHRRHVVSCYSWPGVHPKESMQVYGSQLLPILARLIQNGGLRNISPTGRYFERAIAVAQLSRWSDGSGAPQTGR
jgi:alanine dehydrogenase